MCHFLQVRNFFYDHDRQGFYAVNQKLTFFYFSLSDLRNGISDSLNGHVVVSYASAGRFRLSTSTMIHVYAKD